MNPRSCHSDHLGLTMTKIMPELSRQSALQLAEAEQRVLKTSGYRTPRPVHRSIRAFWHFVLWARPARDWRHSRAIWRRTAQPCGCCASYEVTGCDPSSAAWLSDTITLSQRAHSAVGCPLPQSAARAGFGPKQSSSQQDNPESFLAHFSPGVQPAPAGAKVGEH
jgi:hypothetical protein